ncbi:hypothetical protein [Rufibacter aurantiacus]|uniref:hypothetical protein n=1 Tax=Rufibacter aurantiacus TaxID=2817374 RepID=UPI001B300221|nr:hypothetical protein [Rufibacter aurantiacus]
MSEPTLPLKEKLKICLLSFLLTLAIYLVIDLYVPAKKLLAGEEMGFSELVTHFQFYKKAPFIVAITVLMSVNNIKKKTKALAAH